MSNPIYVLQQRWQVADSVVALACLVLVALSTVPALRHFASQCMIKGRHQKEVKYRYQDEDGVASPESEAAFSDLPQRAVLVVVSLLGVAVSLFFLIAGYVDALCYIFGSPDSCQGRSQVIWVEQCFLLPCWVRGPRLYLLSCLADKYRCSSLYKPVSCLGHVKVLRGFVSACMVLARRFCSLFRSL